MVSDLCHFYAEFVMLVYNSMVFCFSISTFLCWLDIKNDVCDASSFTQQSVPHCTFSTNPCNSNTCTDLPG